jgi:predicted GH43/DUF377 family glycosyl hydrolase
MKRRCSTIVLLATLILGATLLGLAQEGSAPTEAICPPSFLAHEDNPVLEPGSLGSWDASVIFMPHAVPSEGLTYLFYTGFEELPSTPSAIGYATSADGIAFTKSDSNPIFLADGTGFDAYQVHDPSLLVEGSTWVLYYGAQQGFAPGPNGSDIGRATAPGPSGPWTRGDTAVLTRGSAGEWDSGFVTPDSVIHTGTGYVMYYSAGTDYLAGDWMIGMATSTNGIDWTKYDDPTTTEPPYAESDPVLKPTPGGWDNGFVWMSSARQAEGEWEMFFSGGGDTPTSIGYASGPDGRTWTKYADGPVLTPTDDPIAPGIIEVPSVVVRDSIYFLYYDYGLGGPGIGLATGKRCGPPIYLPLVIRNG